MYAQNALLETSWKEGIWHEETRCTVPFARPCVCTLCPALAQAAYTAGTYTAQGQGHNGMVEVEVVFSDSAIESIRIVNHNETPGVSDVALERVPEEIVAYQSLAVDTVAGATYSSQAVLDAVAACVEQAGGDVEALKAVAIEKSVSTETVAMEADVVVVGGGGAGLAAGAARQAKRQRDPGGKMAQLGGNTILSGYAMNAVMPEITAKNASRTGQVETLQEVLEYNPEDFGEFAETLGNPPRTD